MYSLNTGIVANYETFSFLTPTDGDVINADIPLVVLLTAVAYITLQATPWIVTVHVLNKAKAAETANAEGGFSGLKLDRKINLFLLD